MGDDFPQHRDAAEGMPIGEKAAILTWALGTGQRMTVGEVAYYLGTTRRLAASMLAQMARVIPVGMDLDGRWGRVPEQRPPTE